MNSASDHSVFLPISISFAVTLNFACCVAALANPDANSERQRVPADRLSAADWNLIRAAYEAGRHRIDPFEGGWRARNPGQQWTTRFDGRRFVATPNHGAWSWGLELRSYGIGDSQQLVGKADEVIAEGQRLSYRRGNLEEWWINDGRGLEHGFIVARRPSHGPADEPLAFHLMTVGGLESSVMTDGLGVVFKNADGTSALTYGGLKVWDATGRALTARFEPGDGDLLHLFVDDRNAVYPVTIDPIAQQAYLKAANPDAGDQFGAAVAISGDTVVVGAPEEDSADIGVTNGPGGSADNSADLAGAAYVFVRDGATWIQQAYLKAGNRKATPNVLGDLFGSSVAISGDTIVVGAPGESSDQVGVTNGPGGSDNNNMLKSGAAYVFVRADSVWTQQAYLKAGNTRTGQEFGADVAISGDSIVVGARNETSNQIGVTNGPGGSANNTLSRAGAAYVFVRDGNTWSQQAYLKAGNTGFRDNFGRSVSIFADTVIVGAPGEASNFTGVINGAGGSDDNSAFSAGAAYIFVRSGSVWSQQAYLKAGNTDAGDLFGMSVSISGDTAVVGANGESSPGIGVIDGSGGSPDNSTPGSGAAYVFTRTGSSWTQEAYLKAGSPGAGDSFGGSVAISGNLLVVGAPFEDSGLTGITEGNGGGDDDEATESGAAYLFARSGITWRQQAYLKAGNTGPFDLFGSDVAISGATALIGAPGEDGGEAGVGLDPAAPDDNTAPEAGASYPFEIEIPSATPPASLRLSALRFPETTVKRRSRPQTAVLRNVGGSEVTGITVSVSGAGRRDFFLTPPSVSPLAAGSERAITITFAPTKAGSRRAILRVNSSAPTVSTSLSGKGRGEREKVRFPLPAPPRDV